MDAQTWLARCAAALLIEWARYPRCGDGVFDAPAVAADLIEEALYRDLDPEAAAAQFMHDSQ